MSSRMTAELVLGQPCRINPAGDRELDLRGLRLPAIENLAVTNDSYTSIDLSDNSVQRLENFPRLARLRTLLLCNSRVAAVDGPGVGASLPSLECLVLTNNKVASLADVADLGSLRNLQMLSLLGNPVTRKPNYRLFVLHTFPQLRLLDFARVRQSEAKEARKLFGSKKGKAFLAEVAAEQQQRSRGAMARFQAALAAAKSAEDVDALRLAYRDGRLEEALGGGDGQRSGGSGSGSAGAGGGGW